MQSQQRIQNDYVRLVAIVGSCVAVGVAQAHPLGERWPAPGAIPGPVATPDGAGSLNDSFECYLPGESMTSRGEWELWPGGLDATMTDAFASSGSISADFRRRGIDVVHRFSGYTSGQITFSAMTYIDSAADFTAFFIAMNEYPPTSGQAWSITTVFRTDQSRVGSRPMIFDRWVQWRAEVDLDLDLFDLYYDDVLYEHRSWTAGVSGIGFGYFDFAAIDLFVERVARPGFYIDDVVVKRPGTSPRDTCGGGSCYADCDGNGLLDFFDFLCFQDLFSASDPGADCDGNGELDFFDFLCFQNEFAAGCP